MKLFYPLEVPDAVRLNGNSAQSIGTVKVRFPAYLPKIGKLKDPLAHLSDDEHFIEATVSRQLDGGRENFIWLSYHDHLLNVYLFNNKSNDDVLSYLREHQGWPKRVLPKILKATSYVNCRLDNADPLYRWEADILPHVTITSKLAREIVHAEFSRMGFPYAYYHKTIDPPKKTASATAFFTQGYCLVTRRSGWLSTPNHFHIGFRRNPHLHVVLHEIAHALDVQHYRTNSHGPTFMLLYRSLLKRYLQRDYLPSMQEHKLFKGKMK
ncbi:hypothetical protein EVC12_263 [Rhizobium phage RHph_I42]|nr:hypothetical protein EVC12_263 [Rhizobium phage RHph_I42]